MKRIQKISLAIVSALIVIISPINITAHDNHKTIYFFYGQGCSHCAQVEAYFNQADIYERYPDLVSLEIYFDQDNVLLFNKLLDERGFSASDRGVPTLIVGDEVVVGDKPIIENFISVADNYLSNDFTEIPYIGNGDEPEKEEESDLSVPVVVSAAIVDAVNPCAFAVLIILMSTVLAKKSRRQALLSGLAFATAIFVSYVLMGLSVYTALGSLETTNLITNIVGVLAIVLGLFNLKDWLWYGKAFLVEVPRSWRPNMKKLIGAVTSPIGALFVGVLVSLFLLPCTSGPYIVILGLMAESGFDGGAAAYLILYNLIFITPMLVITLLVYKGVDVEKLEYMRQANLERLHLIAGLILIGLGLFVLL